ncbi:DUF6912 family protein [Serinibacter arcticus]|uniref:Uncharacterized protein n=1 Tax=Serinibacter arcticus TaxID=1655435 RepID=A0A4Z1DWV0_9MICO|nr:hypothetical protein [Serinibacter arcticus]TGO04046.1 hypothetical protein SERN_2637 [Serinibacter arcticus]
MRLYVPAVLADLELPEIGPRLACAVTPALRAALPEEDEEGLELSAFLSAADLAALRLSAGSGPHRRVVLALELPASTPFTVPSADAGQDAADLGCVVGEIPATPWSALVSLHVDEPEAADAVRAALTDETAFEELAEIDLLWFDPSERASLVASSRTQG